VGSWYLSGVVLMTENSCGRVKSFQNGYKYPFEKQNPKSSTLLISHRSE
jgi:hypothetical protein